MGEVLIRGYKAPDPEVFAAHFIGLAGENTFDFYTRFDDGASLTTTTMPAMESLEPEKIFYKSSETHDLSEMYQEHVNGIEEHKAQGRVPVPMGDTIADLAREIDNFLSRDEQLVNQPFKK